MRYISMYLTSYIILRKNNQAARDWTVTIHHQEEEIEKLLLSFQKNTLKVDIYEILGWTLWNCLFFRPKIIQTLTTNRIETWLLVRMYLWADPSVGSIKLILSGVLEHLLWLQEVPDSWLIYCLNEALAFNLQRTVSFQMFGCHTHYHLMLQFKIP